MPLAKPVPLNVQSAPNLPLQFESGNGGLAIASGHLPLRLSGTPGTMAVIESSADLIRWTPVSTNTLSADGLTLSVPVDAQKPGQFFRARLYPEAVSAVKP